MLYKGKIPRSPKNQTRELQLAAISKAMTEKAAAKRHTVTPKKNN